MHRTQRREQEHRGLAYIHGMLAVDAIVVDRFHNRFPSFRFDLPTGARGAVVISRHLRENAIAQAERGIAKTAKVEAVKQFVIDRGARNNDFGAAWSDALNLAPFCHW